MKIQKCSNNTLTNAAKRKRAKERAMGYREPPELVASILYNLTYLHTHLLPRTFDDAILCDETDMESVRFRARDLGFRR